jgi:hypothetical protein
VANDVYANGREISCKKADGKSICAFPDVCFTPPQTPATPPGVPIPYPNTGLAKDTTKGSKHTKISGMEIMLRNRSHYKKSYGDEAGRAPKKGILNSKIQSKVYFISWSPNVKVEKENVVRHFDKTTHNHSSPAANEAAPWLHVDTGVFASDKCKKDRQKERRACHQFKPSGVVDACEEAGLGEGTSRPRSHLTARPRLEQERQKKEAHRCLSARRCRLQPYEKTTRGGGGCCPGQTGNHVIPSSYFGENSVYVTKKAPCMCVTGTSWHTGNHQYAHTGQSVLDGDTVSKSPPLTVRKAAKNAATVARGVFPESGCRKACIQAQIEAAHNDMGIPPDTTVDYKPLADAPEYVWRTIAEVSEKLAYYRGR